MNINNANTQKPRAFNSCIINCITSDYMQSVIIHFNWLHEIPAHLHITSFSFKRIFIYRHNNTLFELTFKTDKKEKNIFKIFTSNEKKNSKIC